MPNNFKRFKHGIQIRPSFASDPVTGKVGEIYYNTSRNVLRVCISTAPVWQDVFIADGTAHGALLYWDNTSQSWKENTEVRTQSNSIFAEPTTTGKDLLISAGTASDTGVDGGDLVLEGGNSLGGGAKGTVQLIGSRIKLQAHSTLDPLTATESEIYYNTDTKQFRYYDGNIWKNIEGISSFFPIDLIDISSTTLPATTATLIDNQTILDGDLVLFKSLSNSSQDDRVYRASVDIGGNITWSVYPFGQDSSGDPVHGDSVFVKRGDDQGNTFWFYDSSDWRSLDEILNVVGVQEVPAGTIDGVNTIFTLSDNPLDSENLMVMIDGLVVPESDYNFVFPNTIDFQGNTHPFPGQDLYAFYLKRARPPVGTFLGDVAIEYFTLSSTDISNGFVALANTPQNTNYVVLDVIDGAGKGATEFGVEYTVIGSTLNWQGYALDGVLAAGDRLRVWYLI